MRGRWPSSRALAGALAVLPLGFLLLGSLLVPTASTTQSPPASVGGFLSLTVVAVIVAAGVAGLTRWIPPAVSRVALTVAGAVAAGGSVAVVVGVAAPTSAVMAVLACVVALVWGAVLYRTHGRREPSADSVLARIPERDRVRPVSRIGGGTQTPEEPAPWQVGIQSARMRGLAVFGLVVFGAVVWVSWSSAPWWWLALVVAGGVLFCSVMLGWSGVLVRVDETGLQVSSRLLGVRMLRISPADVLGVSCLEIDPMDWGGWGLRWSARHTAFVVRGGPGLVVHRRSGRPLALEVPSGAGCADEGAARLRRVASRASPPVRGG